jgi:hypothetical protein
MDANGLLRLQNGSCERSAHLHRIQSLSPARNHEPHPSSLLRSRNALVTQVRLALI